VNRSTQIIRVAAESPSADILREAAAVLRAGGLVAFPTETVYGLGADALDEAAVRRVFEVKGRPPDNPLIVHVSSVAQAKELAREFPLVAAKLAAKFWPGPLTLVLRHSDKLPLVVTAGLETVAVRMPAQPVALALIQALGKPVVGPSANLSGRPSPTSAEHVAQDLNGKIEMILDAGPTRIGVESTVLDVTEAPPLILRLGGLTREQIESVIGPVATVATQHKLRRSPGTRHRHYSPRARVVLVEEGDVDAFAQLLQAARHAGHRVGVMAHSEALKNHTGGDVARVLPSRVEGIARELFRALRELDEQNVDVILVETVTTEGLGAAVMDRLRRAAGADEKHAAQ
jgi:L-threonylcarbamoyladenylate synthase